MKPIISYPKSGRTWLRYGLTIADVEPVFDHAGVYTQAQKIGQEWAGIPEEYQDTPVIFLHRNPIDTSVSLYFQILHKDVRPGRKTWKHALGRNIEMPPRKIDEFVLHPLYGVKACCRYNRTWLDHLDRRSDIFTYEQFKADPVSEFRRLLIALDKRVKAEHAQEWSDRASFENMRKVQASEDGHKYRLTVPWKDPKAAKVRRGRVGGYVEDLRPETIQLCKKIAARYGFEA